MSMTGKINTAVAVEGVFPHREYHNMVRTLSVQDTGDGQSASQTVDFEMQLYEESGWHLLDFKPVGVITTPEGQSLPMVMYLFYKDVDAT